MHDLGQTRTNRGRDHLLQTPDTFVRTPLPCLSGGLAIVHASPALGCNFAQYTVEFDENGALRPIAGIHRFVYVASGAVEVLSPEGALHMQIGDYALLPSGFESTVRSTQGTTAIVIERAAPLYSRALAPFFGSEHSVAQTPLMGDPDVQVRTLLPADSDLDFAVNSMTYQPGASLAMVEVHVMEHGLLMLEGGGIYRLGELWYPVRAGDFIWMAPFCPQWFGALGRHPAKYLIYKDCNVHPISGPEHTR